MQVLKRDLAVIAAGGFSNIGLRVSFGELITHWDANTSTPTYNESKVSWRVGAGKEFGGSAGKSTERLMTAPMR